MAETFVKGQNGWWLSSGNTRRAISQKQKDDIAYWYDKAGRAVPATCLDDDGQNPKVFQDPDLDIWGVDVATLQGGGSGTVPPHDHAFSGTTGPAE